MLYLSLGSNLGNRLSNLRKAVKEIKEKIFKNNKCYESIILDTKPITTSDAPNDWNKHYLNMILVGESDIAPQELLKIIKSLEKKLGRTSDKKWAPRIIDIDILLYNDYEIQFENLKIPHAELMNRDFLLHLLSLLPYDIVPTITINGKKIRIDEYSHKNVNLIRLFKQALYLGPKIFGILNVTQDSFSDGGEYFDLQKASDHVKQMIAHGVEIIDIGAQATNPFIRELIGPERELQKLDPLLKEIENIDAKISIDTYHPEVINKLIGKYKIDWINDVSGKLDEDTLKNIQSSGCGIVVMHSLTIPPTNKKIISHDIKAAEQIKNWSDRVFEKLISYGFTKDKIILDPGIGFNKSVYQSLELMKKIKKLNKDYQILIGHSRKSFLNSFSENHMPGQQRDLETCIFSLNMYKQGVDYLRIHNIRKHYRVMVADKLSNSFYE